MRCDNKDCRIPLAPETRTLVEFRQERYCDVCQSMLDALSGRDWFLTAHQEYHEENVARARHKLALLGDTSKEGYPDVQS